MQKLIALSIAFLAAIASAHPATLYRNGREVLIEGLAIEPELQKENAVSELRKDERPLEVDVVEPVVLVKEEIFLPIEPLRKTEPIVEIQEPVAILNEVDSVPQIKNSIYEIPVQVIGMENVPEESIPVLRKQEQIEELVPVKEAEDVPNVQVDVSENQESDTLLRQQAGTENTAFPSTSTPRPGLLQQVLANNPFQQFVETIRRPLTTPRADGDAAAAATTQNPNIFQQIQTGIQTGIQNLTNTFQSVFQPPQANLEAEESGQSASTIRPPNIFENFQQNLANTFNNVFRPPTEQQVAPQPGPIASVLQNVQNFFTGGNRGTAQSTASPAEAAPEKITLPVDDKVDYTLNQRSSEETDTTAEEQPLNDEQVTSLEESDDLIEVRKAEDKPAPEEKPEDEKVIDNKSE